jgi:hypothetical protein
VTLKFTSLPQSETVTIELNLQESGTLCHALMRMLMDCGYPGKPQPAWAILLYEKLGRANDQIMGKLG